MSLLAAPLEAEEVEELRQVFPEFEGELPEEAWYWRRGDLELFLASGGQLRPKEVACESSSATCTLLTRLRLRLADESVGAATSEYRSFCRHLRSSDGEVEALPGYAERVAVQRASTAPAFLKAPIVLPTSKTSPTREWGADFWAGTDFAKEWWTFRSRAPAFEGDARSGSLADRVAIEGSVGEYMEYVRTVQGSDPSCSLDDALAFPRVALEGWPPFAPLAGAEAASSSAAPSEAALWRNRLFEEDWHALLHPAPGIRDLSPRWIRMFASAFNMDWLEFLARYFRVSMGAVGCTSRLHTENHGAHAWFMQLHGRRLFVLFSPADAAAGRLYEEAGGLCGTDGFAAAASPVDVLSPNARRHPKLLEAKPQVVVLKPGETLLVPGGWWRYSVALEMSVTLHHPFWNAQNRVRIVEDFREAFDHGKMPPELQEMAALNLQQLRERIEEDDDSDMDE